MKTCNEYRYTQFAHHQFTCFCVCMCIVRCVWGLYSQTTPYLLATFRLQTNSLHFTVNHFKYNILLYHHKQCAHQQQHEHFNDVKYVYLNACSVLQQCYVTCKKLQVTISKFTTKNIHSRTLPRFIALLVPVSKQPYVKHIFLALQKL